MGRAVRSLAAYGGHINYVNASPTDFTKRIPEWNRIYYQNDTELPKLHRTSQNSWDRGGIIGTSNLRTKRLHRKTNSQRYKTYLCDSPIAVCVCVCVCGEGWGWGVDGVDTAPTFLVSVDY
jgi:hypothetical protein